jgi:D-beta-D-heptose 7-phosphate kinase / D-beta-D-heptose 1-phosphate adenosyltransferase
MNEDRFLPLIAAYPECRVLVLGDVMLDRFIYGRIERISPEAPVPVLSVIREKIMPGGAANVARNIASLGGKAVLMGVIGDDHDGRALADQVDLWPGIENQLLRVMDRPTTTKARYVAETQQMIRVDHEVRTPIDAAAADLLALLARQLDGVDIVVLSDYAKGVLCDAVVGPVIALARKAGKPVVVDPKSVRVARYDGAMVMTPNLSEAAAMTQVSGRDDAAVAAMAEAIFVAAPNLASLVITRSADGMSLAERGHAIRHLPVMAREVFDVSGAGDTVVAVLSLSLAAGGDLAAAAELANVAAGIAVGKSGTAEVCVGELSAALRSEQIGDIVAKNANADQAAELATGWRRQGLQVGFTNGCFDLIHPGHVSLLGQAKSNCDRLIVGLNTDASIKRLKGPTRPVQDELARAMVLGALSAVDLVVLFAEDTPGELIEKIRPDVLIKGADYRVEQIVGADFVQSYGGRVVLADLTPNQSTSGIISRIDKH